VNSYFVLVLFIVTSGVLYGFGRRLPGLGPIGTSITRMLETIGLALALWVFNLGVAVVFILTMRAAGTFVSLYLATDPTLAGLAGLQAIVIQFWRYGNRSTSR
jgi:hypothetical protein